MTPGTGAMTPGPRAMTPGKWLGVLFLTPATLFVVVFFLSPVLLTAVFAFTSMSTATGVGEGGYLITPSTLNRLAERGMDRSTVDSLGATTYVVNPQTLAGARAAGVAAGTLEELARRHAGKTFDSRRDFERALKSLNARPPLGAGAETDRPALRDERPQPHVRAA